MRIRDEKMRRVKRCKDLLFLGFRCEEADYLFSEEWGRYSEWLDVHVAFSRDATWLDLSSQGRKNTREKERNQQERREEEDDARGAVAEEETQLSKTFSASSRARPISGRAKVYVQDLLEQNARQVSCGRMNCLEFFRRKQKERKSNRERKKREKRNDSVPSLTNSFSSSFSFFLFVENWSDGKKQKHSSSSRCLASDQTETGGLPAVLLSLVHHLHVDVIAYHIDTTDSVYLHSSACSRQGSCRIDWIDLSISLSMHKYRSIYIFINAHGEIYLYICACTWRDLLAFTWRHRVQAQTNRPPLSGKLKR